MIDLQDSAGDELKLSGLDAQRYLDICGLFCTPPGNNPVPQTALQTMHLQCGDLAVRSV